MQIIVTVWKQEEEKAEIQEHGYLSILQQKSPCQTFRQDLNTFKAQGELLLPSSQYCMLSLFYVIIMSLCCHLGPFSLVTSSPLLSFHYFSSLCSLSAVLVSVSVLFLDFNFSCCVTYILETTFMYFGKPLYC